MNIGEYSVKNQVVSWLLVIVFLASGYSGFVEMGKLEDPGMKKTYSFDEVSKILKVDRSEVNELEEELKQKKK